MRGRPVRGLVVLLALLLAASTALAQGLEPTLPDPAQEARAQELHKRLRCLVCQNQSIHESNAELARDLRSVVRERIAAGETDAQVVAYVVARYGDWVLLRPPFHAGTVALWLGPPLILAAALLGTWVYFARSRRSIPEMKPLTSEEQARVAALLGEERQG
jgi:cytochrome c-type biogenesis protein CcmH